MHEKKFTFDVEAFKLWRVMMVIITQSLTIQSPDAKFPASICGNIYRIVLTFTG